uniref:Uncharacterized protein n=1 Tax=Ananas comosus var. bracteatus TaxID=296719 RepID=A0A6V7QKE0_ANACO|nr:unnamed protein product [Ananas comosus var. bracteatus]
MWRVTPISPSPLPPQTLRRNPNPPPPIAADLPRADLRRRRSPRPRLPPRRLPRPPRRLQRRLRRDRPPPPPPPPLRLLAAAADSSRRARDAIAEWAAAPRGRISAVQGVIAAGRSLAATEEVAAVDAAVRKLTAEVDDGAETERLRGAVSEVGRATEELTAGLDRLGRAVDAEFRAVMGSRNAALQRIRFGPTKKYYNK